MRKIIIPILALSVVVAASVQVSSRSRGAVTKGTVYVPVYSSIYQSDLKWEFSLAITLSIHNVDPKNKIVITSINYYSSSGKLIQDHLAGRQLELKPLETYNLGIKATDTRGGIGANFIVRWQSYSRVNKPLIETVMIGTSGQQGISFTSRGIDIRD